MGQVAHSVACESLCKKWSSGSSHLAPHIHVHTSFERLHDVQAVLMHFVILEVQNWPHALAHMLQLLEACE